MRNSNIPDYILAADRLERCEWFQNRIFDHQRMREVREQLLRALDPAIPTQVITVCGPTGVGKSALAATISRILRKQHADLGPESMPVLYMECPRFESKPYDFNRQHWIRLLEAADDQHINDHFDPDDAARRRRTGLERIAAGRRSSGPDLRLAAEQYLKLRKTKVLLLDEAQHMTSIRSTANLHEHMDVIKSFGNATGVKQVLLGTEALSELIRCNAQLARRTEEIYFPPYGPYFDPDPVDPDPDDPDSSPDAFGTIFGQLCLSLPLESPPSFDLEKRYDEIFDGCAGCIGVLKEWLSRALDRAIRNGHGKILLSDLRKTRVTEPRLDEIADGIVKFREFLANQPSLTSIRAKLGLPPRTTPRNKKNRTGGSRLPGERNPYIDPVPPLGEDL